MADANTTYQRHVDIPLASGAVLHGTVTIPPDSRGVVVFVHGSGSSRHSLRNQRVASIINRTGCATLLMDLLTREEAVVDARTSALRFDIALLTDRVRETIQWIRSEPDVRGLPLGLFGASTGAAAALATAAMEPNAVTAIVSRGGRPDLAARYLPRVTAPTLLIVGELDTEVLALTQQAGKHLLCEHRIAIIPGASHLFEETGTLDQAAELAASWFASHLLKEGTPHVASDEHTIDVPVRHAGSYPDRTAAGQLLASLLARGSHRLIDPVVVALPRGGVEVALPIAEALRAPIEVVVARKIGVPSQPELALGAVDEEGVSIIDPYLQRMLRLSPRVVESLTDLAHRDAQQRAAILRNGRPMSGFSGRDVILVDDGYATGSTAMVAARFVRRHGARRVLLAVPVAPASLLHDRPVEFNQVICPNTPDPFHAVGLHYHHFEQLSDDMVRGMLHQHAQRHPMRRNIPTLGGDT
jgi:putative phosphoribosyl transferase